MTEISFSALENSDLVVNAVYQSDRSSPPGALSGEPITRLLRVGNLGGFRSRRGKTGTIYCVLTSTGSEPEWPDELDEENGTYTYFGDNRVPGNELHETKQKGNQLLRDSFQRAKSGTFEGRLSCPVFFIFEPARVGRDQVFRGLAIPGSASEILGDPLEIVSRTINGESFENYKATFSILDDKTISGIWIRDCVEAGQLLLDHQEAPGTWKRWVESGDFSPKSHLQKSSELPESNLVQSGRVFLRQISSMQQLETFESSIRLGLDFNYLSELFREGEKAAAAQHLFGGKIRLLRLDVESPSSGIKFWTDITRGDRIVHLLPSGEVADSKILEKFINEEVGSAIGNSTELNQLGLLVVLSEPSSRYPGPETFERLAKIMESSGRYFEELSSEEFAQLSAEIEPETNDSEADMQSSPSTEWGQLLETADQYRPQIHRPEQRLLRKLLLKNAPEGACALCGEEFPFEFLVTAHIKRRADASEKERSDREIVMPVCRFGCDELFERGYVSVTDGGEFSTREVPNTTRAVSMYLSAKFENKRCWWWDQHPGSRTYFSFHHSRAQG